MTFRGSPAATARVGKYPNTANACLPLLVPWHRKQFSYWLTAGFTIVVPSVALIPSVPPCDPRMTGGRGVVNAVTAKLVWALWQSTHVACRLLFSKRGSAASWVLLPEGKGCPIFANSAYTLGMAGEMFDPPLWQVMQFCVAASMLGTAGTGPRSNRAPAIELCGI